jgi:DMSO/TMAO reductase YedYZ molybdopterin-dependent catalytic subunit
MSLRRATPSLGRAERDRLVNLGLAALLLSAVISGLAAETAGTPTGRWLIVLHGVSGLGLLVLSRRKTRIATRSLNRPRRRSGWSSSLGLAALVVIVVLSGLLESTGITYHLGPVTVMQVHIGGAVLAVPLAIMHIRRRPARPRVTDLSRRTLLRAAVVGTAAGGAWLGWEGILKVTGARGATRRFTASHERGSGDPDAMPVTQWFDDAVQRIDPATWRLRVGDGELTLDDLHRMPQDEITAILDCTSMWYAEQVWRGVRLDRLIDLGDAPSVEVRSATGYALRFPARDIDKIWLALDVGGHPLSTGHGFPARIAAPGRRGFWWVKWVTDIQPSSIPWWVQSPFPLT